MSIKTRKIDESASNSAWCRRLEQQGIARVIAYKHVGCLLSLIGSGSAVLNDGDHRACSAPRYHQTNTHRSSKVGGHSRRSAGARGHADHKRGRADREPSQAHGARRLEVPRGREQLRLKCGARRGAGGAARAHVPVRHHQAVRAHVHKNLRGARSRSGRTARFSQVLGTCARAPALALTPSGIVLGGSAA